MTVAGSILDALASAGTERVFGLPGVHNLAFWQEQAPGRPDIVGVRHEQTTVYAADGAARATGSPGAALTTTGPGAANAVAAFGEAAASHSPVVLVASEIATTLRRPGVVRGVLHESADQAGLFEPLAKAVYRPRTAAEVAEAVSEALTTALTWPQGPVYLDVPTDVLASPGVPVPPAGPARTATDPAALAAAVAEIDRAGRVVLWAGGGVVQAGAEAELDALARRLKAPVVSTFAARGVLPDGHPYLVAAPPHEPEVAALIADADLMVAVGTDFDGMNTRNWTMPRPPRLVSVNCDPVDLAKNYPPDVAVRADALAALRELSGAVAARPEGWADPAALRAKVRARLRAEDGDGPLDLVEAVEDAWPAEGAIVADMAVAGYWIGGYASMGRPRRLQYPVGWGTLGYALPAAIGPAAVSRTPTLAVCGDGGLMFAVGELATLAQERLPVTVLVVDDACYGMLRYDQERFGHPEQGVHLATPDFVALAGSFGIDARDVGDAGELPAALRESAARGRPALLRLPAALIPPRTTSPRWRD
ncbi:thiamine pyrophosphate-binding protein [Spirillospora sp. CA-128828]|uniref:thiamine pyrophosphate-binding protein n=1 Tax=Spirillospora sp. CA-128828 TaxID=3240033 RepID=UPI003D90D2E6